MDLVRTPMRFRAVGAVFAVGALVHATGFVALVLHHELPFYAGYPAWRHLAFATVNATLACLALLRPRLLVLPLAAFVAQQLTTHGALAWHAWAIRGEIDVLNLAVVGVEIAVFLITLAYALQSPGAPARRYPTRPAVAVLVTIAAVFICAARVDRPFADFVEANFYGTPAFSATSRILGGLRAIPVVLFLAFLGCRYWIARGRKLGSWGVVLWTCSRAAVAAVVAAVVLKFAIGRSDVYPAYLTQRLYELRPFHWTADYGAFPSGTATVTTAIATVLWRHLPRWRTVWVAVPIVLLAAVLAVNGHWVSDILGGVCLGAFIGIRAGRVAVQRAQQESQTRESVPPRGPHPQRA